MKSLLVFSSKKSMNNKAIIGALAMDLKRIAVGYHRGSTKMAERFVQEALKRKQEIDTADIKPYLKKALHSLPEILNQKNNKKIAEDALTYSIIFQNYTQKFS